MKRREFFKVLAGSAGVAAAGGLPVPAISPRAYGSRIQAVVFDGFAIFDPQPVVKRVEARFPGRGMEITNLWRTRQFEYTWLRTAGERHVDFWTVTLDALHYTAKSLQLSLTSTQRDDLMDAYRTLPPWGDAGEVLGELRCRGLRLAFLSNLTAAMLDANVRAAKLGAFFEPHLTTDRLKTYKPGSRAYAMGSEALRLRRDEIAFAAFAGWDAAGAKWFGYPTVWVNRMNAPLEELHAQPDATVPDLRGVIDFLDRRK